MSILIDDGSRVLVQGITGREGQFHTERMIRYGTRVVGGVTPGRGGQSTLGVPVFDSVRQAVRETGADVSVAFVPAALAADAACEASEAGIRLVVVIAEHVPVLDMVRVKAFFRERGTLLVGPNCPGIISPGKCKVGIMPGYIHRPGVVGLVSRSGTLTYEAVHQLLCRHWRRPHPRAELRGPAQAVRRRPGNRGRVPHRGNRRRRRGARGRIYPLKPLSETGIRVHCGPDRPTRKAHGPCRGHHQRHVGPGRGQDRGL